MTLLLKALVVVPAILSLAFHARLDARDYLDDLQEFKRRVPADKQQTSIERLLRQNPNSAETYILASNWYWNDGYTITVTPKDAPTGLFVPEERSGEGFALGEAGFFRYEFVYIESSRRRAIELLEIARSKFSNRVDIHLGLRSQLDQMHEINREIEAIETFVASCKKHCNRLCADYGRKLDEDPQTFVKKVLFEILLEKARPANPPEEDLFVAVARISVREFPQSAIAWNYLSIACLRRGDVAGRYKALAKAIEIAPEDAVVLKNWLDVTFKLQLLSAARDATDRLSKLNPKAVSDEYLKGMRAALDELEH